MSITKEKKNIKKLEPQALRSRLIELKIWRDYVLKDLYAICGDNHEKRAEITRTANSAQREYDKTLKLLLELI